MNGLRACLRKYWPSERYENGPRSCHTPEQLDAADRKEEARQQAARKSALRHEAVLLGTLSAGALWGIGASLPQQESPVAPPAKTAPAVKPPPKKPARTKNTKAPLPTITSTPAASAPKTPASSPDFRVKVEGAAVMPLNGEVKSIRYS